MDLSEIEVDKQCVITKILGRGTFRKRIMEMGFVRGKTVHVVKQAPLNDPVEYEILGYHVSLRKSEAKMVEVIPIEHIKDEATAEENKNLTFEEVINNQIKEHGNTINIALVGNPNCGKTTFYNYASGSKERTGNYSGVTVDAKTAKFKYNNYIFNITDLPGTYSLTAYSAEEIYVRKFITEQSPDVVINMIDASNLERNLYLTTQLIDMDVKTVAALNMYDELESRGDKLDYITLGKMLGIPFVPTVSSKGKGFGVLFDTVIRAYEDKSPTIRHIHINYGQNIEQSINILQEKIYKNLDNDLFQKVSSRFLAIKMLEKDADIKKTIIGNNEEIIESANNQIKALETEYKSDSETIITDTRYGFISGALRETYKRGTVNTRKLTDKIDNILTHKFLGFPIFLAIIYLMFQTTFTIGQYPMDWIEALVELIGDVIKSAMPDGMLKDLIVDGIIGGVGGVIVFLPNIVLLFMFISLMEDTGYMARVAFLMDKIMHKIGLHGKSFIPMIMGFGCNVPAVMATRTLENRKDRILTTLINPYMSCNARLPLYTVLTAAFFANNQALITLSIYCIGILVAALTAIVLRKTSFKAVEAPFVMELPPYRIPTVRNVLKHMWEKAKQYLKKMGGVILLASIIIWALGYFPQTSTEIEQYQQDTQHYIADLDRQISLEDNQASKAQLLIERDSILNNIEQEISIRKQENSYIGRLGKFIEPIIKPLGFDWKLGISILTGVAAKEIVVSTMGVLYRSGGDEDDTAPLSQKLSSQESPLTNTTAFGFMVFVLLYFPCVATAAAIYKETNSKKWTTFSIIYSLVVAWLAAFFIKTLF